jgi:hypothetical protein
MALEPAIQRLLDRRNLFRQCIPDLYDTFVSYDLTWPSLTLQWLACDWLETPPSNDYLLLGTQTSGKEPNELLLLHVTLPPEGGFLTQDAVPADMGSQLNLQVAQVSVEAFEESQRAYSHSSSTSMQEAEVHYCSRMKSSNSRTAQHMQDEFQANLCLLSSSPIATYAQRSCEC